jgi:hypothetical protein
MIGRKRKEGGEEKRKKLKTEDQGKTEKNEWLNQGEYVNLDWVFGKDHGQKKHQEEPINGSVCRGGEFPHIYNLAAEWRCVVSYRFLHHNVSILH